jgi:hypothetical protein
MLFTGFAFTDYITALSSDMIGTGVEMNILARFFPVENVLFLSMVFSFAAAYFMRRTGMTNLANWFLRFKFLGLASNIAAFYSFTFLNRLILVLIALDFLGAWVSSFLFSYRLPGLEEIT